NPIFSFGLPPCPTGYCLLEAEDWLRGIGRDQWPMAGFVFCIRSELPERYWMLYRCVDRMRMSKCGKTREIKAKSLMKHSKFGQGNRGFLTYFAYLRVLKWKSHF